MRTIWEVITEECRAENPDAPEDEQVYTRKWIKLALQKYGQEVVDTCAEKFECGIQEAEGRIEADEDYTAYIEPKSVIAVKEQIS